MRKIFWIADREYRAMVGTKAFLISITIMPVLMLGSIVAMEMLKDLGDIKDQKIVVIDHTGKLFAPLQLAALQHNELLEQLVNSQQVDSEANQANTEDDEKLPDFSKGQRYLLEQWPGGDIDDQQRWELSQRVRRQEIYAFVEIPDDVMEVEMPLSLEEALEFAEQLPKVKFYSEDSTFSDARSWMRTVINKFVKAERLNAVDINPVEVEKASIPVPVQGLGLLEKSSDGQVRAATEKNELLTIFLPLGVMLLMFMVIFMAAQPMLESVLEEKSLRIAEVLLGSANPYQLMTGKLLGGVGGSLTILAIYLLGGLAMVFYRGWTEYIPVDLIPWFIIFQVCGVLFFASIFMAVGASVTQLKEAQSMLMPVWVLMMTPMFIWFMVIREPNGPLATWFSFFPPATPTMMMLRMSTGATIAVWQPALALLLLVAATVVCVYVAARIFRVGLLWQGKTPKLNELLKWAFRG